MKDSVHRQRASLQQSLAEPKCLKSGKQTVLHAALGSEFELLRLLALGPFPGGGA